MKHPDIFIIKDGEIMISGEFAFYMYDTLGIPPEVTERCINEILKRRRENGFRNNNDL